MLGRLRRMIQVAGWAVIGVTAGTACSIVLPALTGHRVLTELTGSMQPVLAPGDLVVVAPISPRRATPGDVITFSDPEGGGRLVTHRVVKVDVAGDKVAFVTRGDANNGVERWTTRGDARIGRAVYRLPKLGYVLFGVRSPVGRLALLVVPALAWGAWEIRRLWRPESGIERLRLPDRRPAGGT